MSNKLVINPHLVTPTYSGQFPIRSLPKNIRSSSSRGTNISSSPKSASLIPCYPIPVAYSRIRSSKNSAIFYSKLFWPEGGIEPDLNGFLNQKQSAATTPQGKGIRSFVTAGRGCRSCQVHSLARRYPKGAEYSKSSKHPKGKPQLNGLEGGIEPDLNYFLNQKQSAATAGRVAESSRSSKRLKGKPDLNGISESTIVIATLESFEQHWEFPPLNPTTNIKIDQQKILIGFGGGARRAEGVQVPFELDLFSQTRWTSGSQKPGSLPGAKIPSVFLGTVGVQGAFVFDSFRLCAAVNQTKILLQSNEVPPPNPATSIKIDLQNIYLGFGGGARRAEGR
jgi:hypothetical protein